MREGIRSRPFLLAAASALLLLLAHSPLRLLPASFVGLVPLTVALGSLPRDTPFAWRASRLGGVFGLVFWGISLLWIPLVVGDSFWWAFPGYGLVLLILVGLSALFGWGVHRLHRAGGVPLSAALPLAWVGVEWVKAHFPFGLALPWLGLGVTLSPWPELVGLAEWTGESGVSFWLAWVNGLLASRVLGLVGGETARSRGGQRDALPGFDGAGPGRAGASRRRVRADGPAWVWIGVVAVLPAAFGVFRARTLPLRPGPTVAVVGTGVSAEIRRDPLAGSRATVSQALEAMATLPPESLDLILLPEAVVLSPLPDAERRARLAELSEVAGALGTPVVLGILEAGGDAATNSARLLEPGGDRRERYDKVRLVPGMELGQYRPGRAGVVLTTGLRGFGPLICYESLFGDLARRHRLAGAELLLNTTSDVWFGEAGSVPGSLFLHQHPRHLIMRVVENRMGAARAANGGFSLLVDPLGRTLGPRVPPGKGVAVGRLPVTEGLTFFARTGDLVGPGTALLSVLLLALGPLRSRRWRPGPPA